MQPTDDALGLRLLGQVQELRAALDRLNDRADARALKPRLLVLHDASRGITVAPDVGKIVDEFFTVARDLIVKTYGTAAWDELETVEEALARRAPLSAAPGPGVLDRVQERETPPMEDDALEFWSSLGTEHAARSGPTRHLGQGVIELVAEVRRLRSDEWLQRAVDEIGGREVHEGYVDTIKAFETLQKHRDGKA